MRVPAIIGDAYLVTRHEDAVAVPKDERFVKDVRNARGPGNLRLPWMPRALKPLAHTMLDSDGAEHQRLRRLVRDPFTRRYTAQLLQAVQTSHDLGCQIGFVGDGLPGDHPGACRGCLLKQGDKGRR